eukprot:2060401-Pleurochrysis_carterae.AAC.1
MALTLLPPDARSGGKWLVWLPPRVRSGACPHAPHSRYSLSGATSPQRLGDGGPVSQKAVLVLATPS